MCLRRYLQTRRDRRLWEEAGSPQLDDQLLANCRTISCREQLLERLPRGGVVAEVGVLWGNFTQEILTRTEPEELHLIDIRRWWGDRFAPLGNRVREHIGDSSSMLLEFPDHYFDWIYIDADHEYDGVRKDIEAAVRKVKPEGLLVFNDYTNYDPLLRMPYGVARAVNEFCLAERWEIVYMALQGMGFHDVALRKAA